jgi:Mce-associated membrane protein
VTSETRPREDRVREDRAVPDRTGEDAGARPSDAGTAPADGAEPARTGGRLSIPLVPALLVLLALLLGATAFLWSTRPGDSPVRTASYVDALQAARSGVVDLTSFDHLTLDDDIEQIRRVATGDLREEAVAELDASRPQIAEAEAVVNTEVVGGGVTRATGSEATVWLVIESTQQSNASPQAQVVRYRIEVALEKPEDRWLLSGITGTGTENE